MQTPDAAPIDRAVEYRDVDLATDARGLEQIDRCFVADTAYKVEVVGDRIELSVERLEAPTRKCFPLDLDAPEWESGRVALIAGAIVGFVAWSFSPWNARLVVWHFYVDSGHRRQGIGRALMQQAIDHGSRKAARVAWLETSNLNHPGIEAYRRLGFDICGFDLTLYRGTSSEGETALFLGRDIDPT